MKNFTGLTLSTVKGNTLEIVSFFEKFNMYQCKETTATGIVTNPLLTENDLNELINSQSKNNKSNEKMNQLKLQDQKENEEIEQSESIGNFLINDSKNHVKAKNILNKSFKYNNQYFTRKEYVHSILDDSNITPFFYREKWYFKNLKQNTILECTKTEIDYYEYLKTEIKGA
jgi:hypothetical protein